jgi:hypothetical protein
VLLDAKFCSHGVRVKTCPNLRSSPHESDVQNRKKRDLRVTSPLGRGFKSHPARHTKPREKQRSVLPARVASEVFFSTACFHCGVLLNRSLA